MTVVAIHQPNYIPYLGFFDKLSKADIFVLLDAVDYNRRGYCNRNRIRTPHGWMWLTIPVHKEPLGTPINKISINNKLDWQSHHWKSIMLNYKNSPNYERYASELERFYQKTWESLADHNIALLEWIKEQLNIRTRLIRQSSLDLPERLQKTELLLTITKTVYGTVYLSGQTGKDYLDQEKFEASNISVQFHQFTIPQYQQIYPPFIPDLSVLDYLFCAEHLD